MSQIAVQPYVLKDVVFGVDTDSYELHCSSIVLTPQVQVLNWVGLSPNAVFSDTTTPVWQMTLNYAQDWDTTNALSDYLLANAGSQVTAVLQPKSGSGQTTFTIDVILAPGPIGGDVNTIQTGTVTLGCVGQPVKGTSV